MPPAHPTIQRVLLINDYAGTRGGAELVMMDLREGLRRCGVDARLLTSDVDLRAPEGMPDYRFDGITGRARALRETVNPAAVRTTRRVLREFAPQVVHLGMFLTQASPAILPLCSAVPTVWMPNEHRATCPTGTRWLPRQAQCEHAPGRACLAEGCLTVQGLAPRLIQLGLLRRWRSAIDAVVPPGEAMADALRAHGWTVAESIPHPVPASTMPLGPTEPGLIGYAGRLAPGKGVEVLLAAVGELSVSWRLCIVGDGPERARYEALAGALGISDRVVFHGQVSRDEVQRLLAPAVVQVVPSTWNEPFGLVTIEAMARGTIVVASRVGGMAGLVVDGDTGFLVPPGDSAMLARQLAMVLEEPVRLRAMREAARRAVAPWTVDAIARRFLHLYARLAA